MKLGVLEYAVISVFAILISILAYLYFENSHLKSELAITKDSLYISNQNEAAFQSQLTQQADSIQNYAIFVANLQTENSMLQKRYVLLETKYNSEKLEWTQHGNNVILPDSDANKDSVYMPFAGTKNKIEYNGFVTYFPNMHSYDWSMSVVQLPIEYKIELYFDELDNNNTIRTELKADNTLIGNAITTMDSKLFLLLKNNGVTHEYMPDFWDKLLIGGEINVYNESIADIKNINKYKINTLIWLGYQENTYSLKIYKTLFDNTYGIKLDTWISSKQLINYVFGIK